MPHVVVFDLDGTLVDAFRDIATAVNRPLAARGFPTHSLETIRGMVGDGAGKLLERASPRDISPEDFAAIKAEMLTYYHEHPADQAEIYPGIANALSELQRTGYVLGILSNKPHATTVKTLEAIGLDHFFADVVGEQAPIVPRKPHPQGLLALLERQQATRAIMVGDGVPDGEVSAAAGIPFLAVTWGTRTREQLSAHGPAAFADHASELPALVRRLFAE
jgi:phosphoglycolate phosphatase